MKKQSSLLSFALSLFFVSVITGSSAQSKTGKGFSKSDVTVSRTVSVGQYAADGRRMVVVTVTIKKNAYKGPGRIEETFSNNLQAIQLSTNYALFQTGNGKAEFTWNNISEDRQISVSYALLAPADADENQTVSGQFFYQNQSFPITSSTFSLKPTGTVTQDAPTNTSSLDDLFYAVTGSYPQGSVTSPASLPNQPTTPSSAVAANPTQPVQQQPVAAVPAQPSATSPVSAQPSAPADQTQQQVASTPPAEQSPAVTEDAKTTASELSPQTTGSAAKDDHDNTSLTSDAGDAIPPVVSNTNLAPEGLIYRVQIIVVGGRTRLHHFYRKYRITDEIYYDPTEGVPVRVMVGNYNDYKSAKARCLELRGRGITGAFVVSYYMGKRITTAQALTYK